MEARKKVTPSRTAIRETGQDSFIPDKEMEAFIFFSEDRKKLRIADNIGNRISIPASYSSKNNPIVINAHRITLPCGCYYKYYIGRPVLVSHPGCRIHN